MLRVHSIETFGTHEGPGIRFVVFVQGCNYKCLYCHNPDTQSITGGREISVDKLVEKIKRSQPYFGKNGGVTVSGGEPLLQAKALTKLFKKLKNISPYSPSFGKLRTGSKLGGARGGIHTTLDTNGSILNADVMGLLKYTDLVLLDIKHFDSEWYEKVTSISCHLERRETQSRDLFNSLQKKVSPPIASSRNDNNKCVPSLLFLDYLEKINKPVWIRFVLVPGLTDQENSIERLALKLKKYDNIERIEILPYHTLGTHKYKELGRDYELGDVAPPTSENIEKTKKIFEKSGKLVIVR